MATKTYSKHKEYKEFKTSGQPGYTDEQFDMLKSELIPRGSKLDSFAKGGTGSREYHYEYKEEKLPTGKYDRKDLHTVEEYTIPPKTIPKAAESSSYYYEREERELPAISSGTRTYNYESSSNSTPIYSKIKTSKATKDLSHNVDELDSLLDDLQKDQERQLYKSGYTSDTAESSSFDYRKGTPAKAPSSGYSTLKREERMETSSWNSPPPPAVRASELRQEMFREEKTESRVVPVPAPTSLVSSQTLCSNCSNSGTLPRGAGPMKKVTTTVKTYTYEVPADVDPAAVPIPVTADTERTYLTSTENIHTTNTVNTVPTYQPYTNSTMKDVSYRTHLTTDERFNQTSPYTEVKMVPVNHSSPNGHGPYGPQSYKYSETTYSAHNTSERYPSSSPFPRSPSPSPAAQQPPKKLDDLLADFPEARFPTQPDGLVRREIKVTHENSTQKKDTAKTGPIVSKNVAGPAVYYPPGHTPFEKKETAGYQSSAMQAGGGYASGRGMYEYEAGSRSKEKHSEKKTAVPVCLPLCCAMPCVIM